MILFTLALALHAPRHLAAPPLLRGAPLRARTAAPAMAAKNLVDLRVYELKAVCSAKGLKVSGNKADLIKRIELSAQGIVDAPRKRGRPAGAAGAADPAAAGPGPRPPQPSEAPPPSPPPPTLPLPTMAGSRTAAWIGVVPAAPPHSPVRGGGGDTVDAEVRLSFHRVNPIHGVHATCQIRILWIPSEITRTLALSHIGADCVPRRWQTALACGVPNRSH